MTGALLMLIHGALSPLLVGLFAAPENALEVKKISVPHPAHLMAADQYKSPGLHGPAALLDADPTTAWWLPPAALAGAGYSLDLTLARPVSFDHVRILIEPPPPAPESAAKGEKPKPTKALKLTPPARVTQVDLALWDRSLSATVPIYVRQLSLPTDRPAAELALPSTLRWNSALINDEGFGERRRAKGLGDQIPFPPTVDGISIVIRDSVPGGRPATLAELSVSLAGQPVPVVGLEDVKRKHLAYIEAGIRHIVDGRYFEGADRTLFFEKGGALWEIPAASWKAGETAKGRKSLGTWRLEAGRLEVGTGKKMAPVDYALDDAPTSVAFRTPPVAGDYAVVTRAPSAAPEPAPAAPTLGSTPGFEPPPLME